MKLHLFLLLGVLILALTESKPWWHSHARGVAHAMPTVHRHVPVPVPPRAPFAPAHSPVRHHHAHPPPHVPHGHGHGHSGVYRG